MAQSAAPQGERFKDEYLVAVFAEVVSAATVVLAEKGTLAHRLTVAMRACALASTARPGRSALDDRVLDLAHALHEHAMQHNARTKARLGEVHDAARMTLPVRGVPWLAKE
jgi:hypothetical protein